MRAQFFSVIFAGALLGAGVAEAADPDLGGYLPHSVIRREKTLSNRGKGLFRGAKPHEPVFAAGFYSESPSGDPMAPGSVRQLVLNFLEEISQAALSTWFRAELEKNGASGPPLDAFLGALRPMKQGEQIIITTYGDALDMMVNVGAKEVIEGAALQRALLGMFLGERSVSGELRAKLTGG